MRVGNGAAEQHQLDCYGWVLDAAWVLEQGGAIWSVQRPGHTDHHPLPDDHITAVIKNHATVLALTRRVDRAVGETPTHLTAVSA